MAYGRSNAARGTWFQEQQAMINTASKSELRGLTDEFDKRFEATINDIAKNYSGINIMKDAKRMMENPQVMQEYKTQMLEPMLNELREAADNCEVEAERVHLESVADQLDSAWDESVKSFLIQESYNTSTYLPLSTLDFPALVKQYIRFLGKDIIPVQTAASTNIEQRIFIKYLVNNQTGEEYETPAIYFQKDEDGQPLWKKLWNAGKGLRFVADKPILLTDIAKAPNKKLNLLDAKYLVDENGNTGETLKFEKTLRTRLSYDLNIQYVQINHTVTPYTLTGSVVDGGTGYVSGETVTIGGVAWTVTESGGTITAVTASGTATSDISGTALRVVGGSGTGATVTISASAGEAQTESKAVKLPGGGIGIDIQSGGTFINGGITENTKLSVVDPANNFTTTGETVTGISDRLSGLVDFVKGTITASSCGVVTGIYINGHISNENNMRTIGFREYPEIRKFLISDGCRFQLPFTVEDFAEASASLNFNLYNRLVQELVTAQEMFEDESILQFLDEEFNKYDGAETDVFALESYTHTEIVDLDPTSISPSFAGDPFEYRTNAIHNAIASVIYELCDKGKLDNLGFVIYCNPKCARLLQKFVTWTVQKSTEIGGVQMNHAFGVMTDTDLPIRVVASNRVDAYITIPAYQNDATSDDVSREYFYKIVAYPMDKMHVSYKHLRFARHLTNSPENASYADAQNPGGQAVMVTTSSQYKTIAIQGIQGRVICHNTALVPDAKAGLVS